MTLELPNLDDRTFTHLVQEARRRIAQACPEWTDLSPHDPGMALVEAFAHLTEVMLYRLNRLPDKAYVAFLNLLGVRLQPPAAAAAILRFRRQRTGETIVVPAGTRVTIKGGSGRDAPIFLTDETCTIPEDAEEATVRAHHCERVDGELVGLGDGAGGQVFSVARPPIVRTGEPVDLLVGVEAAPGEVPPGAPAREWEGRTYRIWEPVWSFAGLAPDACACLVDRAEGRITFAPSADRGPTVAPDGSPPFAAPRPTPLAAVPEAGREVRVWYRTGGGPGGNVAADTLTVVRDPVPNVEVTNPEAARGGRPMESLENLLRRGPNEFLTVRRAVTAADFEVLAVQSSGAVARAKAVTRADVWSFAQPGEVEVVLVPHVPEEQVADGRIDLETLTALQTEEARASTQRELDLRRPLSTRCVVGWAHCKPVAVQARIVVGREEDEERVRARVLERLYQTISPLPTTGSDGWQFGHALRRSNVYRLLEQAEPGVQWVDEVSFVVRDAPDGQVDAIAADEYQARTWYVASGEVLFRSTNDADGWEPAGTFPGQHVRVVVPYPMPTRPGIVAQPGLVAIATRGEDGATSSVYVTEDVGETWRQVAGLDVGITDLAWNSVGTVPGLLIATDRGLYQLPLLADATPVQVVVAPDRPDLGFYEVAAFPDERGEWWAAVAGQAERGVYLSAEAGRLDSFQMIGLAGHDTRSLAVQFDGTATWLWVGFGEASPQQPGSGASRARLFEADIRWESRGTGWVGGTCWGVDFVGRTALAATQNGGVLRLDTSAAESAWEALDVNAGLPLRDRPRFEPVTALAAGTGGLALAGGPAGVYRSVGEGHRAWRACDHRRAGEVVTVPGTWLLCSAEHQIEVVAGRAP